MACEWVILGGGDRSHKIKVAPALFERIPGATVIDGTRARPAGMSAAHPRAGGLPSGDAP